MRIEAVRLVAVSVVIVVDVVADIVIIVGDFIAGHNFSADRFCRTSLINLFRPNIFGGGCVRNAGNGRNGRNSRNSWDGRDIGGGIAGRVEESGRGSEKGGGSGCGGSGNGEGGGEIGCGGDKGRVLRGGMRKVFVRIGKKFEEILPLSTSSYASYSSPSSTTGVSKPKRRNPLQENRLID